MVKETLKIIGINPGTRYLGIAVVYGTELMDWRIKGLPGKWLNSKIARAEDIISDFNERYGPRYLVIKKLHISRSSKNLDKLVIGIKKFARKKGLKLCQYKIKDLEKYFISEDKLNKKKLADVLVSRYPALFFELQKEKNHKNPYYSRIFEAIALASACEKGLGNTCLVKRLIK